MPSSTWTPAALASEARRLRGRCWRLVEARHRVSTLKLVDTLAEQDLLESLIEATKPAVPPDCAHLDFLLFTPFRYGVYPNGSRFRRAGMTPGVFYGSEAIATAVAETAFWRLLFLAESPGTPFPANPAEYTGFAVRYDTASALDLATPPFVAREAEWSHVTDYGACQALADDAREVGVEAIRYASVRDPAHRPNLALLTCRAFAEAAPHERQSWHIHLASAGAQAICEMPGLRLSLGRNAFAGDPRIAGMNWDRT